MALARTPDPPYHVVVFTSQRKDGGDGAYDRTALRMVELANGMEGFLGYESARGTDGFGITVSYWRDEASITRWRDHVEHLRAQGRGKAEWYDGYTLRVGRIDRETHQGDARQAHKLQ